MAGYQEQNPYASPQAAIENESSQAGPWRDGKELVLLTGRSPTPRACWVTDRTRHCRKWAISSISDILAGLLVLVFVPGVGLPLAGIITVVLLVNGRLRSSTIDAWIAWPRCLAYLVAVLTASLLPVAALFLTISGFATNPWLGIAAITLLLAYYLVIRFGDRVFLGLYACQGKDGTLRVRGVHPDYLNRLPPWPGGEV